MAPLPVFVKHAGHSARHRAIYYHDNDLLFDDTGGCVMTRFFTITVVYRMRSQIDCRIARFITIRKAYSLMIDINMQAALVVSNSAYYNLV